MKVEQAYARLEAGEPPDEQAAAQWERSQRVGERRGREAELRRKVGTHHCYPQWDGRDCACNPTTHNLIFLQSGRKAHSNGVPV